MVFITLLLSIIALLWAANHFVTGAFGLAQFYRVSPLVIGLTLVALGASLPAIMVTITAATKGRSELALGNAIGANIANIGLVLGLTIFLRPLTIKSSLIRQEYPLLLLVMLFSYSLMLDGYLSVMDGCLFLVGCIALICYLIFLAKHAKHDPLSREFNLSIDTHRPMYATIVNLIIGFCILPLSAHYLVDSAVQLASKLGVSDLVMGLTIVAIGTSLPNIATSIVASLKGHDDIAIGNILGSNMYNLLVVMAFPGILNPATVSHTILWRDIPMMFIITLVLSFITSQYKKRIERWHGGLLLLIYCCYIASLIFNAAL